MATQTQMALTDVDRTSQVRIQLLTRSPDIQLPEDTGPILVSTGKEDRTEMRADAHNMYHMT